jgi:hypothetical protein
MRRRRLAAGKRGGGRKLRAFTVEQSPTLLRGGSNSAKMRSNVHLENNMSDTVVEVPRSSDPCGPDISMTEMDGLADELFAALDAEEAAHFRLRP